jgi:hypothetical protein
MTGPLCQPADRRAGARFPFERAGSCPTLDGEEQLLPIGKGALQPVKSSEECD